MHAAFRRRWNASGLPLRYGRENQTAVVDTAPAQGNRPMSVSQIRYLNVVELGRGALQKLAAACQEHGIRRPLIVTDKGVRAAGLVDRALAQLAGLEHVAVYDGTPSNPTEAAAREACALARQEGA